MKPVRNPVDNGVASTNVKEDKEIEKLEVFCRLKSNKNDSMGVILNSTKELTLVPPSDKKNPKYTQYGFTHVFTEHASQKEVFEGVAIPLLTGILNGRNGLLLMYGVTGSGKTYTMVGNDTSSGILPRCLHVLFNTIHNQLLPRYKIKSDHFNGFILQNSDDIMFDLQKEKIKHRTKKQRMVECLTYSNEGMTISNIQNNCLYSVFVSYVEIYNNAVYDLLEEEGKSQDIKILREDGKKNSYIHNVCEFEVQSAEEAFKYLALGRKRRKVAQTRLNSMSSRSHSVFSIHLYKTAEHLDDKAMQANMVSTHLHLVDLAGSERGSRTNNTGIRLKEAGSINNCLMTLRHCLKILRDNQQSSSGLINPTYIPYRERKLTTLFRSYFEGSGKVSMIVCINPSSDDYEENIHVMEFAEIANEIVLPEPEEEKINVPLQEIYCESETDSEQRSIPDKPISVSTDSERELEFDTSTVLKLAKTMKPHDFLCYLNMHRINQHSLLELSASRYRNIRERIVRCDESSEIHSHRIHTLNRIVESDKRSNADLKKQMTNRQLKYTELEMENGSYKEKIRELENMVMEYEMKLKQSQMDVLKQKQKRERLYHEYILNANQNAVNKIADEPNNGESHEEMLHNLHSDFNKENQKHLIYRPAPVVNMRSRRSRSLGESWLEHRPKNETPLDTVFQPFPKRRKAVPHLTDIKDVVDPKRTRYLLVSQGQDYKGDLETKLFKGNILSTCSGGAQVIFDDVERLNQEDPIEGVSTNLSQRKVQFSESDCITNIYKNLKK